mmetsp:Transcript_674/g.1320  ORF Transcript_674/g.1320 Transcript_674/m.1320 type:complete len:192 (-) Transcript_674:164-739(-)
MMPALDPKKAQSLRTFQCVAAVMDRRVGLKILDSCNWDMKKAVEIALKLQGTEWKMPAKTPRGRNKVKKSLLIEQQPSYMQASRIEDKETKTPSNPAPFCSGSKKRSRSREALSLYDRAVRLRMMQTNAKNSINFQRGDHSNRTSSTHANPTNPMMDVSTCSDPEQNDEMTARLAFTTDVAFQMQPRMLVA